MVVPSLVILFVLVRSHRRVRVWCFVCVSVCARGPRFRQVDPSGVARALESYQSVGLQLFARPKRFRRADALQERFFTMIAIFMGLIGFLWLSQHGESLLVQYGIGAPVTKLKEALKTNGERLGDWLKSITNPTA